MSGNTYVRLFDGRVALPYVLATDAGGPGNMLIIHGENIYGLEVDGETRCCHWHSELDIIAIKFKCCGLWLPCFECHASVADHEPQRWAKDERGAKAILCGGCGYQLRIAEYLACDSACPRCNRGFNPGCANHYELYFD